MPDVEMIIPVNTGGDEALYGYPEGEGPEVKIVFALGELARRIKIAAGGDTALLAALSAEFGDSDGPSVVSARMTERKLALPVSDGSPAASITLTAFDLVTLVVDSIVDRSPEGIRDPAAKRDLDTLAALLRTEDS